MNNSPEDFVPENMAGQTGSQQPISPGLRDSLRRRALDEAVGKQEPAIAASAKVFFGIGASLLFWFWWWFPWYIHNSDPSSTYKPMDMADHFARIEGFIVAVGFMIIGALLSLRRP